MERGGRRDDEQSRREERSDEKQQAATFTSDIHVVFQQVMSPPRGVWTNSLLEEEQAQSGWLHMWRSRTFLSPASPPGERERLACL